MPQKTNQGILAQPTLDHPLYPPKKYEEKPAPPLAENEKAPAKKGGRK